MITLMEIKKYEIYTHKLNKEDHPLRIAFLTDLHNRLWGSDQSELLGAIDQLHADLILCGGDMLIGNPRAEFEHALTLFEGLAKRRIPVIVSNGNHESRMRQRPEIYGDDYKIYMDRLKELGVMIPVNETCEWQFGSMKIKIHGYELPLQYYKKFNCLSYDTKDLEETFGMPDAESYHILLAHNPVFFDAYAAWGADLTLSGHMHGGIIRIPGIGGVITPQAKLFPKYDRGLFDKDGKYLAVSAGLGEHTVPIRIFNPRQLICIEIKGTGEHGIIS